MIYFYLLLADLYLFFLLYVGSMGMVRAHAEKKLNPVLWTLCFPFVAVSFVIDVLNNIFIFSFIFFQVPKEWTVTARLKRNVKRTGWLNHYLAGLVTLFLTLLTIRTTT